MEEYHYVKDQDGSALWIKESPPIPRSADSKFRRWLFPALTGVIMLILIVVLGTTSIMLSNHLWSVEQRLSNQSDIIQSLYTSVQHGQDMKISNHLLSVEQRVSNLSDVIKSLDTSLEHAQETAKEVKQLQFAVENNKDQLTSVSKMLKKLSVIDSLSRSVAAIKCSLDLIINNSSATGGCCPLDWTAFYTSCYYFSHVSLSWNDSRDWCETQQAHLVTLRTDKEWEFVTHRTMPELFWVGLSDWRTGSWEWVDQMPYTVEPRRWKPGQPDNWAHHGLGPGNEDCAHLHDDGRLNDQHCSIKERFICQKDILSA